MSVLLFTDLGYKKSKMQNLILYKEFGNQSFSKMDEETKQRFLDRVVKADEEYQWYINEEKRIIMNYLRNLGSYIYMANSIYPINTYELRERRLLQDKAIGTCAGLNHELQTITDILPINSNKLTHYSSLVTFEIALIKGWRKADNVNFRHLADKEDGKDYSSLLEGLRDMLKEVLTDILNLRK